MKRFLFLIGISLSALLAHTQTVTSDRTVVRQSLYLRNKWIDEVKDDTSSMTSTSILMSADAIRRFVETRVGNVISHDSSYRRNDTLYWVHNGFTYNLGTYLTRNTADLVYAALNHTHTASNITDFSNAVQTIGDSRYPLMSGSYINPSWITQLAWGKLTGVPLEFQPVSTSNYYVQNQSAADQSASFRISGTGKITVASTATGLNLASYSLNNSTLANGYTALTASANFNSGAGTNKLINLSNTSIAGSTASYTSSQYLFYASGGHNTYPSYFTIGAAGGVTIGRYDNLNTIGTTGYQFGNVPLYVSNPISGNNYAYGENAGGAWAAKFDNAASFQDPTSNSQTKGGISISSTGLHNNSTNTAINYGIWVRAGGSNRNYALYADSGSVHLANITTDPSSAFNGDMFYNTTLNKFRTYVSGSWQNMIAGNDGILNQVPSSNPQTASFSIDGNSQIGPTANSAGFNQRKYIKFFTDYTSQEGILISTPTSFGSSFIGVRAAPTHTNSGSLIGFQFDAPTGFTSSNSVATALKSTLTMSSGNSAASFKAIDLSYANPSTYSVQNAQTNYGIIGSFSSSQRDLFGAKITVTRTDTLATPYSVYAYYADASNPATTKSTNPSYAFFANTGLIHFANLAADPVAANGDMYFNTASKTFRTYSNGAWQDLGAYGSSGANNYTTNVTAVDGIITEFRNGLSNITTTASGNWPINVTGSANDLNEAVSFVTTDYTVQPGDKNIICTASTDITITLPTGAIWDKKVLYITNASGTNILNFSPVIYTDQTYTISGATTNTSRKLVYSYAQNKWYQISLSSNK